VPKIEKYLYFKDSGSGELWIKQGSSQLFEILRHTFSIGEGIKKYEQRQLNAVRTILFDGARIYLNVKNIFIPKGMKYEDNPESFKIEKSDRISKNGLLYKLFKSCDEGRGWGIFLKKKSNSLEVISQDYLDNIKNYLINSFILEQGIDFKKIKVQEEITKFFPEKVNFN